MQQSLFFCPKARGFHHRHVKWLWETRSTSPEKWVGTVLSLPEELRQAQTLRDFSGQTLLHFYEKWKLIWDQCTPGPASSRRLATANGPLINVWIPPCHHRGSLQGRPPPAADGTLQRCGGGVHTEAFTTDLWWLAESVNHGNTCCHCHQKGFTRGDA